MMCVVAAARGARTRSRLAIGFTLIELLVVIAIIAILAGILFPVFGQRVRDAAHLSNATAIASMALVNGNFDQNDARQKAQQHIIVLKSPEAVQQVFSIFDTNQDGVIDGPEYHQIPAMLRFGVEPEPVFSNPATPLDVSKEIAEKPVYNQESCKHVFKKTLPPGLAQALSAKFNGKKEDLPQMLKQTGSWLRNKQISESQYGVVYTAIALFEFANQGPPTDGTNQ